MRNKSKISITLSILVFSISFAALTALAAPFFGEEMHITQPDGRVVFVRAYGDEFYHRLESLDGYTLIHDPESGYLCYAALNADRSEFLSTGIVYSNEAARDTNVRRLLHVTKGLELDQRHIDRKVQEARLLLLGDEQESRTSIRENTVNATRSDGSVAPIYGVTIIVDFPDTKATQPSFSIAEVEAILNEEGYTGFGNNGSVRDYFLDMSGGLVDYRNRVFYYEAEHSKLHYAAGLRGDGVLANEALLGIMHNQDFIDYLLEVGDDVWMPARGNEMALNIYYAGASLSGALWPHYAQLGNLSQTIHGVSFNRYQITNQFTSTVDTGLSIGMFVHENGHLLFSFTDLYGFQGIGYYCVMANGDSARKNPTPINPYFRYLAGWADPLSLNDMPSGTVIAAEANARNPYIYYTHNPQQQFMVEYIQKEVGSRYEHFPHEGVVVYHITRNGTNLADRSYPMVWVVS
ncbi:MAG: hypothetical protein FWG87_14650, partial [Defluviitaleaceae bacterium]|nr:hypothetical protein [Defluviitaleaceae bacterium]